MFSNFYSDKFSTISILLIQQARYMKTLAIENAGYENTADQMNNHKCL